MVSHRPRRPPTKTPTRRTKRPLMSSSSISARLSRKCLRLDLAESRVGAVGVSGRRLGQEVGHLRFSGILAPASALGTQDSTNGRTEQDAVVERDLHAAQE